MLHHSGTSAKEFFLFSDLSSLVYHQDYKGRFFLLILKGDKENKLNFNAIKNNAAPNSGLEIIKLIVLSSKL